ncbi:MAG TPA: GEGP motif-containing diheme protein [Syntrophales bacterium]|nr:GEGP motif-containing diheme protein [Syntrophales bacterium]
MTMCRTWLMATGIALSMCFFALSGYGAYPHEGDIDSAVLLAAFPKTAGTKLDSCTVCHRSGSYVSEGKTTTLGSCQWCHYRTDYGKSGNIRDTLNSYGLDYLNNGRDAKAIKAIQGLDSDGDGYSNGREIAALRYPGDPKDDPTKVAAPSKVFTRGQLEAMPQHTQFLLMNASKSKDSYAEYTGVLMENLLKPLVLLSATGVMVLSPDGFSQTHPFRYDATLNVYYVNGTYPSATFYYNDQADMAKNPSTGWCDYSAPSVAGRKNGDPIVNRSGLKMILAIKKEGKHLDRGVLNARNKLDGDGPFRVIPPQKIAGPPDQRSIADNAMDPFTWVWPYQPGGDHNAGSSTRSTTIIKVEPLPEGTTDIDLHEAGWSYIDQDKIVIYGAISPLENINEKLVQLAAAIDSIPTKSFKTRSGKAVLKKNVGTVQKILSKGDYNEAYQMLQNDIMGKISGCKKSARPDRKDWLKDCETETNLYWAVNEIMVLLNILL